MSGVSPVLSAREVVLPATAGHTAFPPFSLDLAPGMLALLEAADPGWIPAIADLLCGLIEPDSGSVEFEGRPWDRGSPAAHAEQRAHIGRVFTGTAWVSNLDVDENVILARFYHGDRPAADLRAEAENLARRFGLAGVPAGRPAWADPRDLQVAQWVRAWLGHPSVFVLEEPEAGVPGPSAALLRTALREALAAGAAAVWITGREDAALTAALDPAVRLAIGGPAAAG